ncbi:hypothetical protein PF006_g18218 [Phytophthora fragariae]|uniref:Uncharacterized protein n=1 Tax=Phytophthora fragariae TaxID=53985 RepID=A0A6A3E9Y2_9STRA|nr:hypothetical protein PF009_g20613 [Phytophthora fragariae]KAE9120051.1 hypothetical protein PF006_g18218 [Phytophthora fragariae]
MRLLIAHHEVRHRQSRWPSLVVPTICDFLWLVTKFGIEYDSNTCAVFGSMLAAIGAAVVESKQLQHSH